MARNAHAGAADPGAADVGKINILEDSSTRTTRQAVTRCAGCGRRPRVPRPVAGWRDDRPVPMCARCTNAWLKVQALHGLLYRGGRS